MMETTTRGRCCKGSVRLGWGRGRVPKNLNFLSSSSKTMSHSSRSGTRSVTSRGETRTPHGQAQMAFVGMKAPWGQQRLRLRVLPGKAHGQAAT